MLLGDEEGVEAPETGLYEGGGGHFGETAMRVRRWYEALSWKEKKGSPHLQEDIDDLFSDLEQGVEGTAVGGDSFGFKVVFLEVCGFPGAAGVCEQAMLYLEMQGLTMQASRRSDRSLVSPWTC